MSESTIKDQLMNQIKNDYYEGEILTDGSSTLNFIKDLIDRINDVELIAFAKTHQYYIGE